MSGLAFPMNPAWVDTVSRGPLPDDFGYGGWTFDPAVIGNVGNTLPTAVATILLCRIPFPQGGTFTALDFVTGNSSSGSPGTNTYVAVYNSGGSKLAQSVDITSLTTLAAGLRSVAVSGTAGSAGSGVFLWGALYSGTSAASSNFPVIRMGPNAVGAINGSLAASVARYGTIAQANTATLPNIVTSNITLSNTTSYWMALRP